MRKNSLVKLGLILVSALLFGSSFAHDVTRWYLPDGAAARFGKGSVSHIAHSPDGAWLAVGGSIGVWLYDANTDVEVALHAAETGWTTAVAFSPSGHTFANASFSNSRLSLRSYVDTIQIWETRTGRRLQTFKHPGRATSIAFSPDSKTLAGKSLEKIQLWDITTGRRKATINVGMAAVNSTPQGVVYSPDGRTLACGNASRATLWDTKTGQHKGTLGIYFIDPVAYSPDGMELATGSSNVIDLWDVTTQRRKPSLRGHTSLVSSVAYSPDGRTLASGSHDSTILS